LGQAADNADPEGDGHSNLMEFAFGTSPQSGEAMPVYAMSGENNAGGASVSSATAEAGMKAVFRRRKNYHGCPHLFSHSRWR
jgi:hypothetical protein